MPEVQTPDWVKDAIFYQIFPDRFARSTKVPKPTHLEPWDTEPTPFGYKGGDLLGVVEHLDHIQDLGATALYFCPIFQSASNHRYHTHDYYQVDPMLGGNEAFFTLLEEAHRRGLKVVLDGVFNHASRGFFFFNDILENGLDSAYRDWFTIHNFPPNAYDLSQPPGYDAWWGLHALPKFNHANPQVREYLMRVAEYWVRQGIDGWRLDVPGEITVEGFWQEFRQRVKALNPEAYIVGEIWAPAPSFLQGDQFDATMNYPFTEAVIRFTAGPRVKAELAEGKGYQPGLPLDAKGYAENIDQLHALYPWEITLSQLNLLDSHDTPRLISLAGDDAASVKLATLLLMTYPGAPSLYYGDEIGLTGGGSDAAARKPFPWDTPEGWKPDVLACHKALIALRKAHPALRRGAYHHLHTGTDVYAFSRQLGNDALVVAVNRAEDPVTIQIRIDQSLGGAGGEALKVVYGDVRVSMRAGALTLSLPAREGIVLATG
jgi:glycosidase